MWQWRGTFGNDSTFLESFILIIPHLQWIRGFGIHPKLPNCFYLTDTLLMHFLNGWPRTPGHSIKLIIPTKYWHENLFSVRRPVRRLPVSVLPHHHPCGHPHPHLSHGGPAELHQREPLIKPFWAFLQVSGTVLHILLKCLHSILILLCASHVQYGESLNNIMNS